MRLSQHASAFWEYIVKDEYNKIILKVKEELIIAKVSVNMSLHTIR
jgi:hypothetical protein